MLKCFTSAMNVDSDKLSDLPESNEDPTPVETAALMKLFPQDGVKKSSPSGEAMSKLKLAFYATILFALLGNPWIGGMMNVIPFVGGPISSFATRCIVFLVTLWGLYAYIK